MKRVPFTFLIAALLAAAAVARCGRGQPAAPPARSDVILITIDTLRADRLRRGFTPALDALADSGTRFDNARTASADAARARHAHDRLAAARPQRSREQRRFAPRPAAVLLARRFRDAGYQTGAFVGAYVLDRRFGSPTDSTRTTIAFCTTQTGRGLEAERSGREVVDAALGWLSQARSPYFLWAHLYDPHAPYEPPAEYLSKAGGNAHDGEVAYADTQAGRLFEALKSRGLTTSTRSRLPATTVKAWAITASRRTACSRTTRRCACR